MRKLIFLNCILMLQVLPLCFHLMDYCNVQLLLLYDAWANMYILYRYLYLPPDWLSSPAANCPWIRKISSKKSRINWSWPFDRDHFLTLNMASGPVLQGKCFLLLKPIYTPFPYTARTFLRSHLHKQWKPRITRPGGIF